MSLSPLAWQCGLVKACNEVKASAPQQLRNAAWCLQLARGRPMLQVEGIVIMASCCLAWSQCMLI